MARAPSAARLRSLALLARLEEGALMEKASRLAGLRARIDQMVAEKRILRERMTWKNHDLILELGHYFTDVTRGLHEEEARIDAVLADLYLQERREQSLMMQAFGEFKTAEAVRDNERHSLTAEAARREAAQIEDLLLMQRGGARADG